ncbi:hypothetical protein KIH27_01500 [Mycobacterium sp. M1]|uniref:DUF5666 domain-containing protein n=1 Tax=Mycolicibacter acidiphilus TaxID=2835306 RepID=A0ABS5RDA9_9MYCO|nr:DUF5666 domain-containing protein [Mycolicibacter acidiphilus]MBS9532260.1 hypothetical protein [Mycolicibacter acidiphilus]
MSEHPRTPRFAGLALTGAAALSLAALAAPAPAHADDGSVIGQVTSVAGNSFDVAQPGGSATVTFTDATTASQAIPAQQAEITPGSCLKAGPTPDSAPADSGAITARWVMISTPVNGQCPQRPGAPTPVHHGVRGVVTAVDGDVITVTRPDNSTATVTVNEGTNFRRRVASSPHAVTQGQCVVARGTEGGDGALQAARVIFWAPPPSGHCPQPAG